MQTTTNRDSPNSLRSLPDRAADIRLDQRLFLLDERQFQAFEEALSLPLDATQQQRVSKLFRTSSPWELCGQQM